MTTERTPTLEGPRTHGRPLGLRVVPALRRELRIVAARRGETMEDVLHEVLCHALDRPDLLLRPGVS
jgi:hypothetical protein